MRINRNLPATSPQPSTLSAEVLALRRSWKWAYLSHFLFTFNPVLHLEEIQLSELENDLADGTFEVLPTVIQRLLMSLTPHDKRMILEDWQHQLRRQSLKRAPDTTMVGTDDEPVDFTSLAMIDKLDIFHALCEWQFHNPNNLRARMRDDDEYANWRIEPIAYDAKGNGYWLMGGNRLWMQYAPPRKQAAKRKRPATTSSHRSTKRRQTTANLSKTNTSTAPVSKPKPKSVPSRPTRSRPVRETRSQAAGISGRQNSRPMGTRVSSRLRGKEEEDLWQSIPDEWLKDGTGGSSDDEYVGNPRKSKSTDRKASMNPLDDDSELTSLSDLSELPDIEEVKAEEETDEEEEEEEEEEESAPVPSPNLSTLNEETWETVCVTLAEWEAFPQRFENSTHRAEKAFYKLLIDDLVPMVTEVLKVDVRKKVLEEAVVHRKRSSRIAVKESVREAEREAARRKAEEEKELERHRRWEARARKEEEDRVKRENMRSARLREKARGERSESMDVDVIGGTHDAKHTLTNGKTNSTTPPISNPVKFVVNVSKNGTQTPKDDERWELDCDICHRRGMNLDDGQELMCCEKCNKWQHIRCHDQADFIAGRPRRNWETEEFICTLCDKGHSSQQRPGPSNHPAHSQQWEYGTGAANPSNGNVATQTSRDPRVAMPVQPALKQLSHGTPVYPNGRSAYPPLQAHGQPSYPTQPMPPQFTQPNLSSRTAAGRGGYHIPGTIHTSGVPTAPPYSSAPNMYLSNYSGNYRIPSNPPPQAQVFSSHYRSTIPAVQTGVWSHQQMPYVQAATHQAWNGATHNSGSESYTTSGATQPQQNGYYRPHPTSSPNPLVPSNPLPSAQSYYTGGPSAPP